MVLMIVFLGVAISLTLAKYLNNKRLQRQEGERQRRSEQFTNLLETLRKEDSSPEK